MQIRLKTEPDLHRRRPQRANSLVSGSGTEPKSFQVTMDEVLPPQEGGNLDLNRLWKQLPQAERRFLESPLLGNLKHYRWVVTQIARLTLKKNAYLKKIKKVRKHSHNNEWVELNVVQFLDSRLQKMAALIHAPQNSAFAMLKTIEEIRGLLLDIRN